MDHDDVTDIARPVGHDGLDPLPTGALVQLDGGRPVVGHDFELEAQTLGQRPAGRLDRLVANLLSMSRIEAGTLQPRFAEVDVAELVAACAIRSERLFARWHLDVDVPDDLPLIRADPSQLEAVCNNLLENAVRHTPEGTCVRVVARVRGDDVEITFADTGPGMPSEIAARINASTLDSRDGLGLAICQGIVTMHGGA